MAATICLHFSQGYPILILIATYLFSDQPGGWLPRDESSRNYDVYFAALFHKELHLGFNKFF